MAHTFDESKHLVAARAEIGVTARTTKTAAQRAAPKKVAATCAAKKA